jgi:hypothetical protein
MAMAFLFLMYRGTVVVVVHGDFSFQYYQFSDSSDNIATLNDVRIYINDLALELTNTSAGRSTYDYPVRVLSTLPSTSISFETTFIFSIERNAAMLVALASSAHTQATVTYDNLAKVLNISLALYVNSNYVKPAQSLLSVPIDLATALNARIDQLLLLLWTHSTLAPLF